MPAAKTKRSASSTDFNVPPVHDWRTTDEDEINRRRMRAREESFAITNQDPKHKVFSNFTVQSSSGMTYWVEIRDVAGRRFSCTCTDFRANGLGTCKHVEAVLLLIERRFKRLFKSALKGETEMRPAVELDRSADTLRLGSNGKPAGRGLGRWFDANGLLRDSSPDAALECVEQLAQQEPDLWISQEIVPWLETRRRGAEAARMRHEFEMKVQSGEWPAQETKVPLFPYQREGMLHLAFKERALLADEMGLGKTIQAIAACALLHRLGNAKRVLVVTPASLKTEWEEQIQKFTGLPYQVVFGARRLRLAAYDIAPFFTIVNYEQMLADSLDVNHRLQPDVVILDEAQRIKNWNTKTAQAIKRLNSRYAFVLTGTPIENRIDELHSLMDFINPEVLGPLFRFNRDFYVLDERGRPEGYCNLDKLHERIAPCLLRRRKSDVENELPKRTDHNRFVPMSDRQWEAYLDHKKTADKLLATARKRPLRKIEMDILQRELASMRMICDTNFILDPEDDTCPKLEELQRILEDATANDAKVIVFSEWERMLQLAQRVCKKLGLGFAWHTGKVSQKKRRGEINAFKQDPDCRVFLSTDSGSTGLNLQNASIVVNCDLPWNPAKLEQRIARAWRKNQTRPVTVYNLVSEETIEHAMLSTLASKQQLSDGVLDRMGGLKEMKLRGGRQAFLSKLEQMMSKQPVNQAEGSRALPLPVDRPVLFAQKAQETINGALVRCEERYPSQGDHTVLLVVVEDRSANLPAIQTLHHELFGELLQSDNPVQLEVIDRSTAEALDRLEAAGLIAPTFRSSRPLHPAPDQSKPGKPVLSKAQLDAMRGFQESMQRHLKMARLLSGGGFESEANEPLKKALLDAAKALAIQHRLPEPAGAEDVVRPPLSGCWGENLSILRRFLEEGTVPCDELAGVLESTVGSSKME